MRRPATNPIPSVEYSRRQTARRWQLGNINRELRSHVLSLWPPFIQSRPLTTNFAAAEPRSVFSIRRSNQFSLAPTPNSSAVALTTSQPPPIYRTDSLSIRGSDIVGARTREDDDADRFAHAYRPLGEPNISTLQLSDFTWQPSTEILLLMALDDADEGLGFPIDNHFERQMRTGTEEQRRARLPVAEKKVAIVSELDATECSVCLESLNDDDMVIKLPCKHIFHEKCIIQTSALFDTCPLCRAAMWM